MDSTENSGTWWAAARQPRGWLDIAGRRADAYRAAHQAPAEPEPVTPESEAVAGLDLQQYARVRDQLGIRSASDFHGLDKGRPNESGFPDAEDLAGSATAMAAMANPYRRHSTTGYIPRPRGVDASALPQSLGGIACRGSNQ